MKRAKPLLYWRLKIIHENGWGKWIFYFDPNNPSGVVPHIRVELAPTSRSMIILPSIRSRDWILTSLMVAIVGHKRIFVVHRSVHQRHAFAVSLFASVGHGSLPNSKKRQHFTESNYSTKHVAFEAFKSFHDISLHAKIAIRWYVNYLLQLKGLLKTRLATAIFLCISQVHFVITFLKGLQYNWLFAKATSSSQINQRNCNYVRRNM